MAKEVIVTAKKVKRRKQSSRLVRLSLLLLLLLLIVVYIILQIIYNEGRFTITLDSNKTLESGIAIYEKKDHTQARRVLEATPIKFMDNISYKWLPENIDKEAEGSHNGKNYIAYTFYIENKGKDIINYWYSIVIDDVIKNVDEAARVMVYLNGDKKVYAKKNAYTNEPEKDTIPFYSKKQAVLEERKDFKPNDVDKYTIVIWLEGDDPDCIDNILGGEIKMHMEIREEHKEESINNEKE